MIRDKYPPDPTVIARLVKGTKSNTNHVVYLGASIHKHLLWEIVCPHCGDLHWHGAGLVAATKEERMQTLGHRSSHCSGGKGYFVDIDETFDNIPGLSTKRKKTRGKRITF
jgi:hypothetical protein